MPLGCTDDGLLRCCNISKFVMMPVLQYRVAGHGLSGTAADQGHPASPFTCPSRPRAASIKPGGHIPLEHSLRACRSCAARLQHRNSVVACSAAASDLETALLSQCASLRDPLFPANLDDADASARAEVDALISRLEQTSQSQPLLGRWLLRYASAGTAVTKSFAGSALRALSGLPYVGLEAVQQQLSGDGPQLSTSNEAVFMLGPLGTWRLSIQGTWDVLDPTNAMVVFDGFTLQLINILGLPLPAPKLTVPVPNGRAAEFTTTYCSDRVRVSRGRSRNIFVFVRD